MNTKAIKYLVDRYNLNGDTDIRYCDHDDAIECRGKMPNSNQYGWFFAGYESEILTEAEAEQDR